MSELQRSPDGELYPAALAESNLGADASAAEIQVEVDRLLVEFNATKYKQERVYPTWQEQNDMQYHDSVNGTTTWKDAVAAVKAAHPKP